jgi:hypothetical protein
VITLIYFWNIKLIFLPLAIFHMAFDRFVLKRNSEIKFFKLLGTGRGETFTPRDGDPKRWGLLIVIPKDAAPKFHNSSLINSWRKFASSEFHAVLQPISSHGSWSGEKPFSADQIMSWDGPVAAITRARIKWNLNQVFWRAVPPVNIALKAAPGLRSAIGIGEAPIGLQGTFSRWDSAEAVKTFAYKGAAHMQAIQSTKDLNWYAEELFARFAIISEHGVL